MENQSLINKKLGKYILKSELGQGGMGTVYCGYDPILDRLVAVKVLAPHLVWQKSFVDRFMREARAAARINHPNIVTIHDVGQEAGWYYFVMEYLEGADLTEVIQQRGSFSGEEVLSVLRPLADALDHAHNGGLVHRDIKPSNIRVSPSGRVTVTDFGIARAAQEARLTSTGAIVGTPEYMSPEQAKGMTVDARSDQYSLAVTAYKMLTGRVPFEADNTLALMYKVVHEPPPPISETRPDLPVGVQHAIERAMAKEPGARYASVKEFVETFARALAGEKIAPVTAVPPKQEPATVIMGEDGTPPPGQRTPTPPPESGTVVAPPTTPPPTAQERPPTPTPTGNGAPPGPTAASASAVASRLQPRTRPPGRTATPAPAEAVVAEPRVSPQAPPRTPTPAPMAEKKPKKWLIWVGGAVGALLIVSLLFIFVFSGDGDGASTPEPTTPRVTATEASGADVVKSSSTPKPTNTPTKETPPTRTPRPTATPRPTEEEATDTPTDTPEPTRPAATATATQVAARAPSPQVPAQGNKYKSPVLFQWGGVLGAGQAYQVTAYHTSGFVLQSPQLGGSSWQADLPAENFGEWHWYVSVIAGGQEASRSQEIMFWFDPGFGQETGDNGDPSTPPTRE